MKKQEQLQYLAGIFDSEGCVRIIKGGPKKGSKSYWATISIQMCDKNIMDLFAIRYNIELTTQKRGLNRKLVYTLYMGVNFLRTNSFISDMLPYLNEKRMQLSQVDKLLKEKDKTKHSEIYKDYMKFKKSFSHPVIHISDPYLAGIMDGDGYLSMHNLGTNSSSAINKWAIGLEQRYFPLINYLAEIEWKKGVSKPKIKKKGKHIQTYVTQLTTEDVVPFLNRILPFLIEKKEKCIILLSYIEEFKNFKKLSNKTIELWKKK